MGSKPRGRVRDYTPVGWQIASLDRGQRELAKTLRVTQQTVSKKLRGEAAILLSDLEKLAKRYDVPMTYFFEPRPGEQASAFAMRTGKRAALMRRLYQQISALDTSDIARLVDLARSLARGQRAAK